MNAMLPPTQNEPVELPAAAAQPGEAPRRRGRPPGSKNRVQENIAPPGAGESVTVEKRRPGRPAGSGAAPRKVSVDPGALAQQMLFFHAVAAKMLRIPELELDKGESEMLAKSIATMMAEYGISFSGKTAAMLGLLGTAAIVYGPRFVLIKERVDKQKAMANVGQSPAN